MPRNEGGTHSLVAVQLGCFAQICGGFRGHDPLREVTGLRPSNFDVLASALLNPPSTKVVVRSLAFAVLGLSCAVTPACQTFSVVPADPADVPVVLSHHVVPWSPHRRLAWADYLAEPPAGDEGTAATTAMSLIWTLGCAGTVLDFQVVTTFYPDRSWVKRYLLIDLDVGRQTLQHEQTHFDLAEVYARTMRRFFSTIDRPCDRPRDQLTTMGRQFVQYESDAQWTYDHQTSNGGDGLAQAQWDDAVERSLEALGSYAPDPSLWNSGLRAPTVASPLP